jgi:hypothetical protein
MKRPWVAAAVAGLALATFFWFPGHTWLHQDTQIYVPILERQRDPSVLRNDLVAQHPHDAFTLYDEVAIGLRRVTGLGFKEVLQAQQLVTRAIGILGLVLLAEAFGLSILQALAVAAIGSLGVVVAGPTVLTVEYEPTPRAFAAPLVLCAIGLAARGRPMAASVAGSIAFLYHAPTTLPFWAVFALRRHWRALTPIAIAVGVLLIAALLGRDASGFYGRLTAAQEELQRMRASYVWVSTYPPSLLLHFTVVFAIACVAFVRVRGKDLMLPAMAAIGVATLPLSFALLEGMKWALMPQLQPMRALLFTVIAMQFLSAVAAMKAERRPERFAWLALALLPVAQPVFTQPWAWKPVAVAIGIAAAGAVTPAAILPSALAAFLAIPILGGVVNYPKLHTPELAQLSAWARTSTSADAVFLFPDSARGLAPGIFRSEALRAVYVDWKGGGQVNYLGEFGEQWRFRWQQTLAQRFNPSALPRYGGLGIRYIVLTPKNRLPRPTEFENPAYLVYRVDSK